MKIRCVSFIVLLVASRFLMGQEVRDTILLSPFEVSAGRESISQITTHDSLNRLSVSLTSVVDQIRTFTPIFIKEYSPGGISTLAFRGTSASHTIVLFDGFPVNPAMSGQADFSTMPPYLYDRLEITASPIGLLINPEAIGGVVSMYTNPNELNNSEIRLRFEAGSFGSLGGGLHFHQKAGKFLFRTRVYYHSAENDFSYINNVASDWIVEKRVNAGFEKKGLMQEVFYIDNKQIAFLKFTGVHNFNELPANLLQPQIDNNESFENDNMRLVGGYSRTVKNHVFSVKGLYSTENWEYVNASTEIEGVNKIKTASLLADWQYNVKENQALKLQWFTDYQQASSANYMLLPDIVTHRISASGDFVIKQIHIRPALHLMKKDKRDPGFSGVLVIDRNLLKDKLNISVSGGRSIRYPGFNDLYWFPGGNPLLLPEVSLSIGIDAEYRPLKWWALRAGATMHFVNNWVVWQPTSGSSVWSPVNIKHVNSRSYDAVNFFEFRLLNINVQSVFSYSFCRSLDESDPLDATFEKQLIYVPMHSGSHSLQLKYKNLNLKIRSQYTGKRYTRSDNLAYMPAHFFHEANVGWKKSLKSVSIELFAGIYNFTAENYQIIAWQPLPQRYFKFGIEFRGYKKKK